MFKKKKEAAPTLVAAESAAKTAVFEPTPEMFEKLDESSKNAEKIAYESKTYFKDAWERFKQNKLAMVGLIFLAIMIMLCIFVPLFSPYTYDGQDLAHMNEMSSLAHPMGTDYLGRDLLVRVMMGGRSSLVVGFAAAAISLVIGVTYGGIAGYCGGKVDMVMQRIQEVANGIPRLVIVTLLLLVLQPGMVTIIFALMLTEWVGMSRIARAEMLKLKEQEFVLASRTLGAGSFFIIFREVLPNIIGPIITQVMFSIPTAIFTEAFLSFVGLGIPVPQCSLGSLISEGFNSFTTHPYQIIPPIVVMALLMLSFNLVADGLREALDPKMKEM